MEYTKLLKANDALKKVIREAQAVLDTPLLNIDPLPGKGEEKDGNSEAVTSLRFGLIYQKINQLPKYY